MSTDISAKNLENILIICLCAVHGDEKRLAIEKNTFLNNILRI